jgi:hypothetical protein
VAAREPLTGAGRLTSETSGRVKEMPLWLKIVAGILVIWAAFYVIGFIFKVIGTLLIVAAVVTVIGVGYAAIKGKSGQKQIRP